MAGVLLSTPCTRLHPPPLPPVHRSGSPSVSVPLLTLLSDRTPRTPLPLPPPTAVVLLPRQQLRGRGAQRPHHQCWAGQLPLRLARLQRLRLLRPSELVQVGAGPAGVGCGCRISWLVWGVGVNCGPGVGYGPGLGVRVGCGWRVEGAGGCRSGAAAHSSRPAGAVLALRLAGATAPAAATAAAAAGHPTCCCCCHCWPSDMLLLLLWCRIPTQYDAEQGVLSWSCQPTKGAIYFRCPRPRPPPIQLVKQTPMTRWDLLHLILNLSERAAFQQSIRSTPAPAQLLPSPTPSLQLLPSPPLLTPPHPPRAATSPPTPTRCTRTWWQRCR